MLFDRSDGCKPVRQATLRLEANDQNVTDLCTPSYVLLAAWFRLLVWALGFPSWFSLLVLRLNHRVTGRVLLR